MSKGAYEFDFILPDETAPQDHLKIEELGDLSLFNPSYPYRSLGNVPDMIVKNSRSICPVCKHKMDSEPFELSQYGVNETLRFSCPTCGTKYSLYMKGVAETPYATSYSCPVDNNVTVDNNGTGLLYYENGFSRYSSHTVHIGYYTLKDILENAEFIDPPDPSHDTERTKLAKDPDWVRYIGDIDNKWLKNVCTLAYMVKYYKKVFIVQMLLIILAVGCPIITILSLVHLGVHHQCENAEVISFMAALATFMLWLPLREPIFDVFDIHLAETYQNIKCYDEMAQKAKEATELRIQELRRRKGWVQNDI